MYVYLQLSDRSERLSDNEEMQHPPTSFYIYFPEHPTPPTFARECRLVQPGDSLLLAAYSYRPVDPYLPKRSMNTL